MQRGTLINKIRQLPPEKQADVEAFVDFLSRRDEDRHLTEAAAHLPEDAFSKIWDNDVDSAYDKL